MDDIIKRYCPRIAFDSYEDMKEHFTIDVPEDFNFGFDVVDAWAELEPTKQALLWTNDAGDMKRYTFADMKAGSNRAANFFKSKGIRKGDYVMLILKQRPEVWMCFTALHKIGAVVIPASFQLTPHDLVYRLNAAGVKMLVTVDDAEIIQHCEDSLADCPTVETYAVLGEQIRRARSICKGARRAERRIRAPHWRGRHKSNRHHVALFLLRYNRHAENWCGTITPILSARSRPRASGSVCRKNRVHLTQTDSGWAKFAWGKIYGQWICGACIGAYDTEKFTPHGMLEAIQRLRPCTFCAPATIYRFLIKEDLTQYDFSFIEHASLAGEPLNP